MVEMGREPQPQEVDPQILREREGGILEERTPDSSHYYLSLRWNSSLLGW